MKKKIIIGVSAYVGSNLSRILTILEFLLNYDGYKVASYSLEECTIECIQSRIAADRTRNIHIVHGISTLSEVEDLKTIFPEDQPEHVLRIYGIEVPWEDCLKYLRENELVPEEVSDKMWRDTNEKDEYRNRILAIHKSLGTRNDYIYFCQQGCYFQEIARLADDILLLQ